MSRNIIIKKADLDLKKVIYHQFVRIRDLLWEQDRTDM